MGIVYQAIRADEVFQRVCAIKVIRPEISTESLLQRFREERQILARARSRQYRAHCGWRHQPRTACPTL